MARDLGTGLLQAHFVGAVGGADEDADAAAARLVRVDARALERLPGRLQQQPLLRVHGEGLARRDPEEGGVEQVGLVQEAARPGIVARLGLGRPVQRLPAAVDREAGDGVLAAGDQPPQLLGRIHVAGVAAAHRDDGDGVVVGRGGGHRVGLLGVLVDEVAQELAAQVVGEEGGVGVVEDDGGGQLQPGGRGEPVAELDRDQRVEAQLLEGPARLDGLRAGVSEHRGHLGADQVEQGAPALGRGQREQPLGQRGAGGGEPGGGGAPAGAADQAAQQRRHRAGAVRGAQRRQVQPGRDEDGPAGAAGGVEERHALVVAEGAHAAAGQPQQVGLGQCAGDAAGPGPQAPDQGGGGQALGVPVAGERVEEDVARGVVGLAGAAQGAGDGGEQDEGGQVEVAGELVQVPRRVHLGAQHAVQLLGREAGHGGVVQDTGGVHDGGERVGGRDGGQGGGQRLAVGGVAAGDGHLGAQRGEFLAQLVGAGGLGAAAAGEQQVADAVLGDQVAGEQAPQAAGAAGDQYGALGVQGGHRGVRALQVGRGGAGQARHQDLAVAQRQFGFPGGQRAVQGGRGGVGAVEVDEDEAVRVLGLGGAQQAPQRGVRQVGDVLVGAGGDRAPGDEGQLGVGEAGVGQPALHQLQRTERGPVGGGGEVLAVLGGGEGGQHQPGRRGLPRVDSRREGGEVREGGVGDACRAQPEGVGAEYRAASGGARLGGDGPRCHPVQPEQRLLVGEGADGTEVGVALRQRAEGQRVDGGDRLTGGVGEHQRDGVLADRRDPYAQRVGADRVQGHALPGGGQAGAGAAVQRVQHRVEQRRVDGEGRGGRVGVLGQPHLGEQFVAAAPSGGQPLEERPVPQPGGGQLRVEVVGVDRLGAGRRPGGQLGGGRRGARVGERAGGVPGPRRVGGVVGTGGDGERAAACGVPRPDLDLDAHPAAGGQHQRGLHGEFGEVLAADLVTGADRQLDEGGARQHGGAEHGVVGQPRVAVEPEPPGEQEAVAHRQRHRGAEQRVVRRLQTDGRRVTGGGAGLQPEPLVLEGVRGEFGPAGAGARVERGPVDRHATDLRPGEARGQRLRLRAALAQHRHEVGLGAGDAVLAHRGEHPVGAQLHEGGDALGLQGAHRVQEADGLTDVTDPEARVRDLLGGNHSTRQTGDDRDARGLVRQTLGHRTEGIQHAVHARRVEGVRNR
ncbi:hypothetical protein GCM10010319_55670 [Streptomyces blastmyceticus]|uniref:Uncharacterized protein n=1 Tax=Streptomyces blastmyceticus TaxID=68180 RepID=A0ABN0XQX0_9ACTN